ncbi:hypothetical protein Bateq7PJ16_0602 [Bacillus subtilis]|nr:hypothetical protein Bateq7PJ16_0602 [Bacillus subtilis]
MLIKRSISAVSECCPKKKQASYYACFSSIERILLRYDDIPLA